LSDRVGRSDYVGRGAGACITPARDVSVQAGPPGSLRTRITSAISVFRQVPGTFRILWRASPGGTIAIAVLSAIAAIVPAGIAYVGKLIVDGVVTASRTGGAEDRAFVYFAVGLELALMAVSTTVARL